MCATIRRSQNFKERIQVLLAFGKLIRGNALKHSLGFILESICKSMVSLPHDTPAQHTHAKKFKVEVQKPKNNLFSRIKHKLEANY